MVSWASAASKGGRPPAPQPVPDPPRPCTSHPLDRSYPRQYLARSRVHGSMSRIIGIDLGTTNSLGAYVTEEGPVIIPNALGEPLTPSVVGMDKDGKLLVGGAAKEL